MHVDGSCHCGRLTYTAEIDPAKVSICHCTDCQAMSSSAFRMIVVAEKGSFRLLSGEPTIYVTAAGSGCRLSVPCVARTCTQRLLRRILNITDCESDRFGSARSCVRSGSCGASRHTRGSTTSPQYHKVRALP